MYKIAGMRNDQDLEPNLDLGSQQTITDPRNAKVMDSSGSGTPEITRD
jgi:hypothetical protein